MTSRVECDYSGRAWQRFHTRRRAIPRRLNGLSRASREWSGFDAGREWQDRERPGESEDTTSVVLREEQNGNWVMVKKCRGRGDGVEYSLYPDPASRRDEYAAFASSTADAQPPYAPLQASPPSDNGLSKTRKMRPFFESLLHASACLQYSMDQYVYSLYGIEAAYQLLLEEDLKLESVEAFTSMYPRWNGRATDTTDTRGKVPEWTEEVMAQVDHAINQGEIVLGQKGRN